MNKIEMVKGVGEFIITMGVSKICWNIVGATMPAGTGKLAKVLVTVGGAVISNMATEAAIDHVEKKINSAITEVKEHMEKTLKEERETMKKTGE